MNTQQVKPERCECHDCTQARYRTSFQYQLDVFRKPASGGVAPTPPCVPHPDGTLKES